MSGKKSFNVLTLRHKRLTYFTSSNFWFCCLFFFQARQSSKDKSFIGMLGISYVLQGNFPSAQNMNTFYLWSITTTLQLAY